MMLGALVHKVIWPWLKNVNELYAARVIESAEPELKSSLLNVVDLRDAGQPIPPSVMKAMEKRAAVSLSHVDVDQAVDRRPLLRMSYVLLGVVVIGCLYTVFSPKNILSSLKRALLPTSPVSVATQTIIADVTPGDESVPAKTQLVVEADIRGVMPERVELFYTTADHKFVDQSVEMRRLAEDEPRFRGVITGDNGRGLSQDLTYFLTAGDARTQEFRINVIQPPSAKVETVEYAAPPYMQFEAKSQPGGQIDGWEGTTVTLIATTNMPVQKAWINFTDTEDARAKGEELRMQVTDGTKLRAEWKLAFRTDGTHPRFYHIQVETAKKERDPDPTVYAVKIRPDQPPEVALLAPTGDLEMPANGIVPLVIQAADPDFLLRFITLKAEKGGESIVDQRLFEDRDLGQTFRGTHDFALAPLSLKPGDKLEFWVEAKDNKQPTANRKNTPRLNIKIIDPVSPKEAQQQLAQEKQKQQDQLAQADDRNNDRERPEQPARPDNANNEKPQPPEKQNPNDKQPDDKNNANNKEPGRPGPDDKQNDANSNGEKGNTGDKSAQPKSQPKTDGSDDNEVLKELIRRDQDKQQQDKQNQPQDKSASDKPGNQGQQKSESQKPGEKSEGNQQQPGNKDANQTKPSAEKKPGNDPNPGAEKKPGSENKPGNEPQQPGQEKKPGENKPGDNQPDANKNNQPGEKKSSDNNQSGTSAEKKPAENKPDEKSPSGDNQKQGEKNQPGEKVSPDSKSGANSDQKQPGSGNEGSPDATKKESPDPGSPQNQPGAGKPAPAPDDKSPANPGQGKTPNPSGEEKPANDSPDAIKKQASGNETGKATPDDKPDPNAAKAKYDLERDPNDKPGAKKPGDSQPQPGTASDKQPKPGEQKSAASEKQSPNEGAAKQAGNDSKTAKPATETKNNPPQPGNPDENPSARPKSEPNNPAEKRAGQPDAGNDDLKGDGRKQQKSEQPQGGEGGGSKQNDQGNQGGNKSGAGDKSQQPGGAEKSDKPNGGQSSGQKGEGSSSKPAQGENSKSASGGSAKSAEKKSGDGGSQGSEGSQKSGSPGSGEAKPSNPGQPGAASPSSSAKAGAGATSAPSDPANGPRGGEQAGTSTGEGDAADQAAAEKANLEYAKKATDLVLKRLKDELDRGEVDQELLDKLGWTKEDMRKFAQRLEQRVNDKGTDDTPEATARRLQFEESLKSLELGSTTKSRTGDATRERRTQQIDARRLPVPAEYREQYEAYTKELSKQK